LEDNGNQWKNKRIFSVFDQNNKNHRFFALFELIFAKIKEKKNMH
jgi:hypothetical protein